ncbi:glycerol-3-phosphate responsive antiterminator [Alteribacillus iranensis]|uniref:Glycerol uptake operon antiterminator regulatory protein n=1 Tax=Alteribacillus iranensis TaxID=930128 RepID=A0A1I2BJA3_9BACI|nr:glycerol-3-phosphate responsive antiterminator [Alteribacillus iranensis]SFE56216.1 glycerol uptake operon antiterminator [Alteribacillus iranensis]
MFRREQWEPTYPITAAVRDLKHMDIAVQSAVPTIFLMCGDILTVKECVDKAKDANKKIYLHVDLIKGLANVKEGIMYLAKECQPDGIVTTKTQLIKAAKEAGLTAIQQVFLFDTQAYHTALKNINKSEPDAVEMMPALMPRVIEEFTNAVQQPVIAGGLIQSQGEIEAALEAGANAVTIGNPAMWEIDISKSKGRQRYA